MSGKANATARGTLLRRFLVLAALMFWQGGFTFYAAVVVPTGQQVLGLQRQALVTRQVTFFLNLAGAVALVPLAWDVAVTVDRKAVRLPIRWGAWTGMLVTLFLLMWLHQHFEELLDPITHHVVDEGNFRTGHRWYLGLSTVQWACSLVYAVLTLQAWRGEDQAFATSR